MTMNDAAGAIGFYKKAFGAEELVRMNGPGGTVMHAEIRIGDSMIMLGGEMPAMGTHSPQSLGGNTGGIMLYVEDVDALFQQAVAAGATVEAPLADMFWGDGFGKLKDPFGHSWSMATHKEDVAPAEMKRRMDQMTAEMAQGA
jgi:PhnB protein